MSSNNFGHGPGGGRGPPMSGNQGGMGGMGGMPGMSGMQGLFSGTDQLPPEYAGLANMSEEDRNAALAALLGPEGLKQLQQQQQQMGQGRGMGGQGNVLGMQGGMEGGHGGLNVAGGMSRGLTNPMGYGGMGGDEDLTNSMGIGGQGGTGGYGGSQIQQYQQGNTTFGGGGRMDYGNRTQGPTMSGNSNFRGDMGPGGSMYGGGGGGGDNGQLFTTPQNFIGQGGGSQYGESQLPPTMAGGRGGSGGAGGHMGGNSGQGSNQDPYQQLISYVKTTAESCTDPIAQGMNTILILDTSSSMQGEGMKQARTAIEDILTGIEENVMDNGLEENLALIVFGRESKVVQHLTDDYAKFRDALDLLHPEGPSAIVDALVMTLGLLDRGGHIDVGGHVANSRIIILSDAQFTTNDPSTSFTDVLDPRHAEQMANEVSHLANQVTSSSGYQLFFIPVGNANSIIIDAVIGVTNGQTCSPGDAKSLSKGYLHHVIAGCVLTQSPGMVPDQTMVAAIAKEKYSGVEDKDIEAVMGLILKHQNPQSQGKGRGQGMGRGQMMGQMPVMGRGQGMMPTQLPSHGGPPGSLPAGLFNDPGSSSTQVKPTTTLPGNHDQLPFMSKQSPYNTSPEFSGLDKMGKHLPSGTGGSDYNQLPMKTAETEGTELLLDLNSKLPPGLPSALIGGEGARRAPQERTPAVITAEVMKTMKIPPELEETRKRTWTLSEDILEEMKRDMVAGKDDPKPWDSPCLQEFLLIRKDGTKIEQDGDGNILGDDEEAVIRREEKAKQKLLFEELKKACEGHPELPTLLSLDEDDIGDLTEERVNELLDDFGGGPPKIENLPIMPVIGLRVKPGPDWMWKFNGVGIFEKGTVIGIDEEDKGWIRVKWDEHNGLVEDYRWGLDYEFDVEPIEGGMEAVLWPEGKVRIIKTTKDIANEFGPKQVKEKLRALAKARREERRRAETSGASSIKPTYNPPSNPQNVNDLNLQNNARNIQAGSQQTTTATVLPERVPKATSTATSTTTVTTATTSQKTAATTKESSKDNGPSQIDRPAAVEKSNGTCFVWQYNEQGTWKNYQLDIQKQLEETYLKRKEKGTVIVQIDGQFERVVFQCMEQRNNVNKKKIKKVRRTVADAESLR
ncbi:uncharacterized protein LOC110443143 isoform X2 [Mizuhopecten yessoensis]|uniref:uncharacterized protein LOC110443143 isoform X2 n=1 Tax=Mizuhopecten yessoensis TaxID=6573 RepID=UPI000B459597|nr:uncharacterized protein LOC110443143 isoform X2 [Mizuhopecten yessoensis]